MGEITAGMALPRTIKSTGVPSAAKAAFDIAHGDGRIEAGTEAAGSDLADDAALLGGDLRAFAGGRAALWPDADPLDGGCAIQRPGCAAEILCLLAALADGPEQIGFGRIARLVHVMAVKTQARFQPQTVARAKPDRQHFAFTQQRTGDRFGIRAFNRNLEPVLAGISGAADDGGRTRNRGARHLHEGEIGDAGRMTFQHCSRERPLQRQKRAVEPRHQRRRRLRVFRRYRRNRLPWCRH